MDFTWSIWPIVKRRLRRQENARGEWSVVDLVRGYRICRYNHEAHGGTHVHFPEHGPSSDIIELEDAHAAEMVMRRYHEEHQEFDLKKLQGVIEQWRSASAAD